MALPDDQGWFAERENNEETFAQIADVLYHHHAASFRWRDGHGSAMSIVMSLPTRINYWPGLATLEPYLFVGIEGYGCHPFLIRAGEHVAFPYVGEKLMNGRCNLTTEALATLIAGVSEELVKL